MIRKVRSKTGIPWPGKPRASNAGGGITRKNIIKVCEAHSIPFEIRDINIKEIKEAKEAFITSSTKRIIPVCQIDEVIYNSDYASSVAKNIYDLLVQLEH